MRLFAEHEPLTDFALAIGAEEQPPIIGDLKPEAVIDSQYFFVNEKHTRNTRACNPRGIPSCVKAK